MSSSFGLRTSLPSLAPGSFSSLDATATWLTQPPLSQGIFVFVFLLYLRILSCICSNTIWVSRVSLYFKDDPHCDHGRVLLCDGHHWELHERADLQKVNIALFQKDTFVTHCHYHNSPSSSPPSSLTFRFNSYGSSFALIMIISIIIMIFIITIIIHDHHIYHDIHNH